MYTVSINLPSGSNVAIPYFPIVNAMPPNAPMGENIITMCNPLNTYFEANCNALIIFCLSFNLLRIIPNNIEIIKLSAQLYWTKSLL